jgi:hypothetical protein
LPIIWFLISANQSLLTKAIEQAVKEIEDNIDKIKNLFDFQYTTFTFIDAVVFCTIPVLFNCPHTRYKSKLLPSLFKLIRT